MPIFTPKERRAHYTAVANGTKPVKPDSQYPEEVQRAYARGQRDARNDATMGFLLGKNSPLTELEKEQIRARRKERNEQFKAARAAEPAKGKRK